MASRKPNKEKEPTLTSGDTDVPSPQENKPVAHWSAENKKLFIDLTLKQIKIGNRPGKGFKPKGWKNIINGFKEKADLTYIRANSRTRMKSKVIMGSMERAINNTGMGYDPDAKTLTIDEQRWQDMITLRIFSPISWQDMIIDFVLLQANPKVKSSGSDRCNSKIILTL